MMPNIRSLRLVTISVAVGALVISCGSSDKVVNPPEQWVLTASDEFDGEEGTPPDPAMWAYDIGGDGWGNQQLEFNTDRVENVSQDGSEQGNLRIVAREESYEGNDYTSARIKTQGLAEQKYGRFEARIKLPEGQGLWPAFWMLGANVDEVGWPDAGEIDVMEYQGQRPGRVFGSLHGPGYSGGEAISGDFSLPDGETFADDFHILAVEWDPSLIRFSVDGEAYHTVRSTEVPRDKWVFDHEFFVILNLAVGGTLGGPVGPDTVFPAEVLVDYVRIFERAR
jgi:beta-glucanase (GH16 family)